MAEVGGTDSAAPLAGVTSDLTGAAFISYASQDGAVAQAVCQALEGAGLACWIAPRNVRAGDFYADAIVQAINSCRVLVLILSRSAIDSPHVLREVERASAKARPIISIHTDATPLPPGLEYFLSASHWLDASKGPVSAVIPALIEAVRGHQAGIGQGATAGAAVGATAGTKLPQAAVGAVARVAWPKLAGTLLVLLMAAGLLYLVVDKIWLSKRDGAAAVPAVASAGASPSFAPPPHSVAVLPFENLSGDPKQDYFSDGLSEELLNSLAAVRELQVAARTSAFSFKGRNVEVGEIARRLNVGNILEGSVRKEGDHVRITAQLINAVTGFQLWSKTYDRDLKGVLKLQSEVASQVSSSLKATLLNASDASPDSGGTDSSQAFDAYLRAETLVANGEWHGNIADYLAVLVAANDAYSEALRFDPRYANAWLGKAHVLLGIQRQNSDFGPKGRQPANDALAAARTAAALAPQLGIAHATLAEVLSRLFFDFPAAAPEYQRALELSPGDARVLTRASLFLAQMGSLDEALVHARRVAVLDPLNANDQFEVGRVFDIGRRYREAIEAYGRAEVIDPHDTYYRAVTGVAYLKLGDPEAALQACTAPFAGASAPPGGENHLWCLTLTYGRLGRHAEAEAALAALKATAGNAWAYQFAQIYAQWGDTNKALDWLDIAYQLKDAGLIFLKMDKLLDPLRQEPRFQAIYAKLNFPP
jgi:TolB-like protein